MTEKLAKEFEKIRASLFKSKKLILADIDKIDEKYRRLAQEEKKNLTENLGILNEQLKYYDNMLGGVSENTEDISVEEQKPEEEPKIQDTIFPENNEPETKEETAEPAIEDAPQPEKKESGMTKEDIVAGLEAAGFVNIETIAKETKEESKEGNVAVEDIPQLGDPDWNDPQNVKTNDDGWPQW